MGKDSQISNFLHYLEEEIGIAEKQIPYYRHWVERYRNFNTSELPEDHKKEEFLEKLSESFAEWQIQQAFNALLFFFKYLLCKPIDNLDAVIKGNPQRKLPVVLSKR